LSPDWKRRLNQIVYGYVEGHEDEALVYLEELLSTTAESEKRMQIERTIANLRKVLAKEGNSSHGHCASVTNFSASNGALNSV
jgi:hypothetical protein